MDIPRPLARALSCIWPIKVKAHCSPSDPHAAQGDGELSNTPPIESAHESSRHIDLHKGGNQSVPAISLAGGPSAAIWMKKL